MHAIVGAGDVVETPNISATPTVVASPAQNVDAASFDTTTPIKHVVFLVKENRTFDNLFGTFPGANGVTVGMDHGVPPAADTRHRRPRARRHPALLLVLDPGLEPRRDGRLRPGPDGGLGLHPAAAGSSCRTTGTGPEHNALFDNFFASAWGPSFPNHLYSIAAQSGGARDNPRRTGFFSNTFGCDAPPQQVVEVYDSEGNVVKVPPCFNFETEGDLLTKHRIPWAYYAATEQQRGYIWSAYAAIDRYRNHPERWAKYIRPTDHVLDDIAANELPPVTWITPRFELSEHPEFSFCHGENWTTQVVDAIMRSPMWEDTAIFITWDDYGGFYDHVAAARRGSDGVRVPRAAARAEPVRGRRQGQPRVGRVLQRDPVHRGQLVAAPVPDHSATARRRRCSRPSTSRRPRDRPTRCRCEPTAPGRSSPRPDPTRERGAATLPSMTTPEPDDEGYLALSRSLYWSQETGARPQAGTKQVREQMLEYVANMRTDERMPIPLGEPHLAALTPWKRKVKYLAFRGGRFASRRYDRLLGDSMDLTVALAERLIELEQEVATLQGQVAELRHRAEDDPS